MHLADNVALNQGLMGGLLLGTSATAFLFLTGKITGISGICEGVVKAEGDYWNISYLSGLGVAGMILSSFPGSEAYFGSASDYSVPVIIVSGLLTGFGTRLAKGCTSGHGLCGLPRRSPRSLAAVGTFMLTGAITAGISRSSSVHALLTSAEIFNSLNLQNPLLYIAPTAGVIGLSHLLTSSSKPKGPCNWTMHATSFASALLFGLGLGLSGMCSTERVLRFLDFAGMAGWDPTLAAVLGGGVCVTALTFPYFHGSACSAVCSGQKLDQVIKMDCCSENMKIDWKLLLGSALFGTGWGLYGACPGPALVSFGAGVSASSVFVPSMMVGMLLLDMLKL